MGLFSKILEKTKSVLNGNELNKFKKEYCKNCVHFNEDENSCYLPNRVRAISNERIKLCDESNQFEKKQ